MRCGTGMVSHTTLMLSYSPDALAVRHPGCVEDGYRCIDILETGSPLILLDEELIVC